MGILVLGRPLTFGDIEQIEEIKRQETIGKLKKDTDFNKKRSKYFDLQNEIDEIEREQEEIFEELVEIAEKYQVSRDKLCNFLFK